MDESIEIGNEIEFAVFWQLGIEKPRLPFELREVVYAFEIVILAEEKLLLKIVGHDLL